MIETNEFKYNTITTSNTTSYNTMSTSTITSRTFFINYRDLNGN